jgi:hypothetical protein
VWWWTPSAPRTKLHWHWRCRLLLSSVPVDDQPIDRAPAGTGGDRSHDKEISRRRRRRQTGTCSKQAWPATAPPRTASTEKRMDYCIIIGSGLSGRPALHLHCAALRCNVCVVSDSLNLLVFWPVAGRVHVCPVPLWSAHCHYGRRIPTRTAPPPLHTFNPAFARRHVPHARSIRMHAVES